MVTDPREEEWGTGKSETGKKRKPTQRKLGSVLLGSYQELCAAHLKIISLTDRRGKQSPSGFIFLGLRVALGNVKSLALLGFYKAMPDKPQGEPKTETEVVKLR